MAALPLPERLVEDDLVLRSWTTDDAPVLHAAVLRNLEHLRPFMPWIADEPQSVEQRAARIAEWKATRQTGGDAVYGVFLDGAVAGGAGLHRRVGPQGLEIGYWIDAARVGRGLATRVARILTSAAFDVPGVTHVRIACDEANQASVRVPEKLGYLCVGVIAVPVDSPAATGRHRLYRMDRARWVADRPLHPRG
jgi:RimJ/RimL family protein N-acetyltransferase